MWDRWMRDIFREIEYELRRMRRLMSTRLEELTEGEPYIYGFSITVGPEGRPIIRTFGSKPGRHGERGYRKPFIDVMEDEKEGEVRIIAEMPGVEKKDIDVRVEGRTVTIKAEDGRRYMTTVDLPADVDPSTAKASYRNGILEVVFKTREKPKGRKIPVE